MRVVAFIAVFAVLAAVATATPGVKTLGHRRTYPKEWTEIGAAPKSAPVSFIVALKQRNLEQLEQLFWAVSDPKSPEYQNFMSQEEILSLIAPEAEDVLKVKNWLYSFGQIRLKSHGDALEVFTNVEIAEKLLSTKFLTFKHQASGRVIFRQFGTFGVPARIASLVHMVSGVSEFPFPQRKPKIKAPLAGSLGIIPQTVQAVYNASGSGIAAASTNRSQGVIEFEGQSFSPQDLQGFASQMGLTIKALSNNHIVGPNSGTQPGTEATLDIQYIAAVGQGEENWFWLESGSAWVYGWAVHFFGTSDVPKVVSISYGWSEAGQCQEGIGGTECQQLGVDSTGYVQRTNVEFQKVGLRGVSILVASGDSGANGRSDGLCTQPKLFPAFPASSPYVTAVGATQLNNAQSNLQNPPPACNQFSCASGGDEVAVSYSQAHFASGGGFSNVAAMPSYQSKAVSQYLSIASNLPPSSYYNKTGRGYPDLAAFGSDIVIYQGGLTTVGGTSASSPIFAGVIADLNSVSIAKSGKTLGFLNPLLYQMHESQPDAFNDITVGDNHCTEEGCGLFGSCKGFYCAKGWDPVTGLGSPNFPKMKAYIESM